MTLEGLKLSPPIKGFDSAKNFSQLFGVNAEYYKKELGIPGHNALDFIWSDEKRGFGTPVLAMHGGVVSQINYDVPHKTKGNGIYIFSSDGRFYTNYWHLATFEVRVGQVVEALQVIGTMGNSGNVTPRPSPECPLCGTHLHGGLYVPDHANDYGSFVDPLPYLFSEGDKLPIVFGRDLFLGSAGDDVSWLQTCLRIEGFASDYDPIAKFGYKTLRDVVRLQKKHGISPAIGYVGKITRSFLNGKYSAY